MLRRHGKKPIPKEKEIYLSGNDGIADIISSNDIDHARIRRALSHAFSEASLREQEPLMNVYFDLLIQKLYEQIDSPSNAKVNIVCFFNFTTFDLIGDLCFAESTNALRTQEYNSWIANIFKGLNHILRHNDEKGMTRAESVKSTGTLIIAGSETTATLLSGALFHLLKNPSCTATLVQEIRTAFEESADMTFVSVGVHQWGAYRSATNFALPDQFLPERWLDDPRFASDNRGVVQPFSVGLRNCLGQHHAMAEMRAILARSLWHFDIDLCEESRSWNEQKVFILWEKPDLMVTVKARVC
ncbi:hypothetical protein BPOR_0114g00260 [Botrytis porri]|uniref:Cytochrome P450 monooxygenase n=1 Tax=Botrytis porri TaxID=87229 RepID=A0A4Z1KXL9_9HELO|nr:hypothetical protein BPOR_0114g00260 [Botrytis porri]